MADWNAGRMRHYYLAWIEIIVDGNTSLYVWVLSPFSNLKKGPAAN